MNQPWNISMMMLVFRNYYVWIKEIQKLIIQHKIWEYIDSKKTIEKSELRKAFRVFDYQVKLKNESRQIESFNELFDKQRNSEKIDLRNYQMKEKYKKRIIHKIKIINNVIKFSTQQYISFNEIKLSTRQIILISRYQLTQAKIMKQM
jgi:hypothetical protein